MSCCKKESTCYTKVAKKYVSFGPSKVVKDVFGKAPKQKKVTYGEVRKVECGKYTTPCDRVHKCCGCEQQICNCPA